MAVLSDAVQYILIAYWVIHSGLYPLVLYLYLTHPLFPHAPLVTPSMFSISVHLFLVSHIHLVF